MKGTVNFCTTHEPTREGMFMIILFVVYDREIREEGENLPFYAKIC